MRHSLFRALLFLHSLSKNLELGPTLLCCATSTATPLPPRFDWSDLLRAVLLGLQRAAFVVSKTARIPTRALREAMGCPDFIVNCQHPKYF